MSKKQELIDYVMSLTPEQIDKIANRLDLLKQAVHMEDHEAIYISHFTKKLFGHE